MPQLWVKILLLLPSSFMVWASTIRSDLVDLNCLAYTQRVAGHVH
jgi:hypothetical protein